MSDRRTEIRNAYRQTGGHAGFYDGMMTCSTILGKAICRVVWNMDGEMNYNLIYTDNIETLPPVVRATGGIHLTGEDCKKQNAEGIVYVPVNGRNTRYSIGLATVGQGNVLAELLIDEAQSYFQNGL